MVRLILSIVSLIFLSWIIGSNIGNTAPFNLFGRVYENVSVVVIALLSFVLGIIYSFGYFVYGKIRRAGAEKLRRKKDELKEKERMLKGKLKKGSPQKDEAPPSADSPL